MADLAEPGTPGGAGAPHLAPALVACAVAAAYAGAFAGAFQFDDWNVVVRDPRVQSLEAWWRSMPGIRPLLKATYAVNHASGLGLAGFHAVNVALHVGSALLAFALVARLEARCAAPGARPGPLVPALAALLFALHPIQTEAVTYVSGRSAALAGALALASALAFVAGRDGARPALAGVASPLLFACALGAKEVAFVLPAVLVLLEATSAARPFSWRGALRATAPHWAVLAGGVALFLASPVYRRMVGASLALRDPAANVVTHLHGLAWLGGQVLRPDRLDADPVLGAPGFAAATAGGAVVVATVVGLALLRRRPAAAAALLWTVLWLPAAGWVVPRNEPANDRQAYLALLGPAWLAARLLAPLARGAGARRAAGAAVLVALLVALAAATAARNRIYADEVRFWEAVLATSPANARAHNNLAVALAARCRLGDAEAALRRALAVDPENVRAAVNLRLVREGAPLGADEPACAPRPVAAPP